MAKRFCAIFVLACFGLTSARFVSTDNNDGQIEVITVNSNKVDQVLRDLKAGNTTLTHRTQLKIEYKPMDCQISKWSNMKYLGELMVSGDWVESEEICVSLCWQYTQQGHTCKSVNYFQHKQKCELMRDSLSESSSASGGWAQDSSATYIEPISCEKFTEPTPTQPPTSGPTPKPPTWGANSNNTNNIRPGSCGQTSVAQRVRTNLPGHRIVGGNEARQYSIPWIVSLRKYDWHYCGGTLVRVSNNKEESDIVITAAHCMSKDAAADFDLVAGAHYRGQQVSGQDKVAAAKVVIHPNYNTPQAYANDIAIVKLARPIKFSKTIQPACLPQTANDGPADNVYGLVAGWGALEEGGGGPESLYQVVVPVIGTESCKQMYGITPEAMLCAGYDAGQKDSCQGDSGGPFFFEGKQGYTLQGIVSWGSGCARPRAPGVYTRVTTYIDWIQQQIRSLSSIRA